MADFKIRVETTHDDKGTREAQSALQRLGSGVGAAWAGVTAAVAGATAALVGAKAAVNEYAEAEERFTSLAQAVANQSHLTKAYAASLQELADKMESTTAIADDRWIGVLEKLTKAGADPENIERYTKSVADLAGLMGGDIESAASMFSRAMQGSFEMLGRFGVKVRETGTDAEKLDDLMKQAAERGGGILEARAQTLTGQVHQLSLAWEHLKEGIGGMIAQTGILQFGIGALVESVRWLRELLPNTGFSIEQINNRMGQTAASADRVSSSINRVAEAFEKATKNANEFQQAEDAFLDDETELKLAQIDAREAAGVISPTDARVVKAGIRLAASKLHEKNASDALDERAGVIKSERGKVEDRRMIADYDARQREAFRDSLIEQAVQARFRSATYLRNTDHKQVAESLDWEIRKANFRGDYARAAELRSLGDLPYAMEAARDARTKANEVNETSAGIDRRFGSEEAKIEQDRQRLYMRSSRSRLENVAEVFRSENSKGGMPIEGRFLELLKASQSEDHQTRQILIEWFQQQIREKREFRGQLSNMRNY